MQKTKRCPPSPEWMANTGMPFEEACELERNLIRSNVMLGRSCAVGERIFIDQDEWEVIQIEQPYDECGSMLEPIVHLKMHLNAAWPLYRMTKKQAEARKQIPLFEYLNRKGFRGRAQKISTTGQGN